LPTVNALLNKNNVIWGKQGSITTDGRATQKGFFFFKDSQ
jgi:hypothetical protein